MARKQYSKRTISSKQKHKKNKGTNLSRNQREYIEEYGHLPELQQEDEINEQRILNEDEIDQLDQSMSEHEEMEDIEGSAVESEFEDEEVSAFDVLMKSVREEHGIPEESKALENEQEDEEEDFGVEEVEEHSGTEDEQSYSSDEEATDGAKADPFAVHYSIDEKELKGRISKFEQEGWESSSVSETQTVQTVPGFGDHVVKNTVSLLKQRLIEPFKSVNTTEGDNVFTAFQKQLSLPLLNYKDLLFANRTWKTDDELRKLMALHTLNHVFKTRDKVLKNNEKLRKTQENGDAEEAIEYRDQGFTRPKVLVVFPFKHHAFKFIEALIKISGAEQCENKKRFKDEFSLPQDQDVMDPRKPKSYKKTFEGNIDDCFRIGIKMSRKAVRLYSKFYSSDIIVASPLGLKLIAGDETERKDADFLSSIEVVIVDHADTILMQNWDHLMSLFALLNCQPKEFHDCDFSRVKHWYLEGQAKSLRQTVLISGLLTPEINALWNRNCVNVFGKTKFKPKYPTGTISLVRENMELIFERMDCTSYEKVSETRLAYFRDNVLPSLTKAAASAAHICVVVPSYFDFIKVRKHLKELEEESFDASFGYLNEYTPNGEISRTRSDFFHGKTKILVVTERYYFYKRHKLRGIKHLVFYAPPVLATCYSDMINMMADSIEENSVSSLFYGVRCPLYYTKYDALALERILGTELTANLLSGTSKQVVVKSG
ncbi:hypothetical protein MP638_002450 [Amoeboaphelidium occidentale]|nr:hypothetical protein MP638_002450 [Amoeboaphelidium occidentale]